MLPCGGWAFVPHGVVLGHPILGAREFRGNVYGKHQAMPQLTPAHFARWLQLFAVTTDVLFAPDDADALQDAARGMARGLQIGLFGRAA